MKFIRKAKPCDISRIAEIEIFNYRLYFYPIFQNDVYYFHELQVLNKAREYQNKLYNIYLYDDGVVKGFIKIDNTEVKKLFVEPVMQNKLIGSKLLEYAIHELKVKSLWALEKNTRAISFYKKHGFKETGHKKLEEHTKEYLVLLEYHWEKQNA